MAPNPHWFAEDAVIYHYDRGRFSPAMFVIIFWMAYWGLSKFWPASESFVLILAVIGLTWMLIRGDLGGEPPPHRFETRFAHITQYANGKILVHESMRDLISLEPVMNTKNGKVKYHVAKFWNGQTIKIYPSLERHDELVSKLQDALSANCKLQTVDS